MIKPFEKNKFETILFFIILIDKLYETIIK
jgi:hypothetical protein